MVEISIGHFKFKSININGNNNEIDYTTWTREEWSGLYKELYNTNSLSDATTIIWSKWNDTKNKKKKYFANAEALIINLATYRISSKIGEAFIITWESIPIYASWSNWWNNVEYWQLVQWKLWYKQLKIKNGKTLAQAQFQNAWSYSENWGSYAINPVGEDSMGYEGGYDCDFINFFRHEGIDVALWGAENLCTLVNTGSNLVDATENVSEVIESTTNIAAKILPYLLMTAAAFTIYSQVKKFNK